MKTVAAILIMFIALTAFVDGPTKVVFYGTVVNDTTGLPMPNVDIRIAYGFSTSTKTDSDGNFRIEVEKKYCVDSLFYFGSYSKGIPTWEEKLIPFKFNEVRYKNPVKEKEPVFLVYKTINCFGTEHPADWYKMEKEQKRISDSLSEKVEFYGRLVYDASNLPMIGANVKINYGITKPVLTDSLGNFCIEVDRKLCVDSLFQFETFAGFDYEPSYEQKLIPGKYQIVRCKLKKRKPLFIDVIKVYDLINIHGCPRAVDREAGIIF